jgi:hypothetical protein
MFKRSDLCSSFILPKINYRRARQIEERRQFPVKASTQINIKSKYSQDQKGAPYRQHQILSQFLQPNLLWTSTMILMMPVSEMLYRLEHLILKDDTGVRLEGWTNARNSNNRYRKQLRNFSKVCTPKRYIQLLTTKFKKDSIKSICRPMAMAVTQNWKLGTREDGVEAEEVVLCIQGIICGQELPPIRKPFEV